MADPYVIFPGTAGNYLSTPDVNLLDADTAHLSQSVGKWGPYSSTTPALSTDQAYFGDTSAACSVGAGLTGGSQGVGVNPALSDGDYVVSVWIYSDIPLPAYDGTGFRVLLLGDTINLSDGTAHAGNGWQQYQIPFTAKAGGHAAGVLDVWIQLWQSETSTTFHFDAASLRTGTDPTFTPSLRIVGTLFEETVPADMPIVFAADGTPLTVGDGWAGDGYSYRRYDGADASAPLVAEFLATDIPVAAQLPA